MHLALLIACGREKGPSVSPPPQPSKPTLAAKAPEPASAAPQIKPAYRYNPQGRRDPFQPLITPKPPASAKTAKAKPKGPGGVEVNELKLSGIIWGEQGYYALVEAPNGLGYIIKTGDAFGDGVRVVRITKESVLFEVKGDELLKPQTFMVELKLRKEE